MDPIDRSLHSEGTSLDAAYVRAHKRAEDLQGLYIHLLVYVVINLGLFAINWIQTGGDGGWWFQWATLGWGIGLLVHILVIVAPVFSEDWTDRKAQRLLHQ
jgi:hypothetical protein